MLSKILNKDEKKAQIWIETVIYTLIGLILIGMVLAVAKPAINKMKDQNVVKDTITSMNEIDNQIDEVKNGGTSSAKKTFFLITKGELIIDGKSDKIRFVIDDISYAASEAETVSRNVSIPTSNLKIQTQKLGKGYRVEIWRDFSSDNIDIQFDGDIDKQKTFNLAPTPYVLMVENLGREAVTLENLNPKLKINIYEVSR